MGKWLEMLQQVHQYHFSRFHIWVNIRYLFFSFKWTFQLNICALTSFCMTGYKFIHLPRTDSNSFFFMAEQYSIAWRISRTEEPGGLQSMGLQRVRHDWVTNTYLLIFHCIYVPHLLYPFICQWTSRLLSNGDMDVQNGFVETVGEGESGMNGESSINIYTLSCVNG